MPAKVLFALQSPTLLNNLAQAKDVWTIQVAKIGEVDFQEESLIGVEKWDSCDPDIFVGCVPEHHRWAARVMPWVPRFHMIHSCDPDDMGGNPSGFPCVGLQRKGLSLLDRRYSPASMHLLSPAYEAVGGWSWTPSQPWGVMSRPKNRSPSTQARMAFLQRNMPALAMYGQDQPMGFLSGEERKMRMASSSCLVSMVGDESGFGLMEHEAMADGVPVVARQWGDMVQDAPEHPALARSDEELLELARRCCLDRAFAQQVSEAGLEYIRRARTMDRLRFTASFLVDKADEIRE